MDAFEILDDWTPEDHWIKNLNAAVIHRERRKMSHPMCSYCLRRNCDAIESPAIRGRKALKKSKIMNGPKRRMALVLDLDIRPPPDCSNPEPPPEEPEPADDIVV